MARTGEWSLGSDSDHWLTLSKTMGTSVLHPQSIQPRTQGSLEVVISLVEPPGEDAASQHL